MPPAHAVDAPGWISFPGASPSHVGQPFVLSLDERFGDETVQELERWGHVVARGGIGGSRKMIMKDADSGVSTGGISRVCSLVLILRAQVRPLNCCSATAISD